jgi:hypothetical protein
VQTWQPVSAEEAQPGSGLCCGKRDCVSVRTLSSAEHKSFRIELLLLLRDRTDSSTTPASRVGALAYSALKQSFGMAHSSSIPFQSCWCLFTAASAVELGSRGVSMVRDCEARRF